MALELMFKETTEGEARPQIEADKFMRRLFSHNEDIGAISSITTGQPGSCKTAASCSMCETVMQTHPEDKIFWRSALNAPIQIFKLPKWHLYVEKDSGIRFYDRNKGVDITDNLYRNNHITYFTSFEELYNKAEAGICNGVFFKDLYLWGMTKDQGNLQWFRFIRFLLHNSNWDYVFIDEYQEMVKANSKGNLFWEIDTHADDVSTARKACVAIHANCHQIQELDYRIKPSYMLLSQMYGSLKYSGSPVSKKAIAAMHRPKESTGAEAWLSEGGNYGHIIFKKVYVLPKYLNIEARIIEEYEHTATCPYCYRKFRDDKRFSGYCSNKCRYLDTKIAKKWKK